VTERRGALVIGLGNAYRHDDGAGLEVARRMRAAAVPGVRVLEHEGDPSWLVETWSGLRRVFIVDAVASGARPGTIHRFDAALDPPPAELAHRGTHAISVADAIELGRVLGRLPDRLVVYGIEGTRFEAGVGMTAAVRTAAARVADSLLAELADRHARANPRSRG
jgi:hydrogenase maturation protease